MNVEVNINDVLADLAKIDEAMPAQAQQIIARSARKFETKARASTPVGPPHRGRKPLSTGWQLRDNKNDPWQPHIAVANIRPHAHLAAEGWNHVGGKVKPPRRIPPFVPWIRDAIQIRAEMVDELTGLVQGGLPVTLRALEVTR